MDPVVIELIQHWREFGIMNWLGKDLKPEGQAAGEYEARSLKKIKTMNWERQARVLVG